MPSLEAIQAKFDKRIKRKVYQERIIYIAPKAETITTNSGDWKHYGIKSIRPKYRANHREG